MTRNLPFYPLWITAFVAGMFPVNSWQIVCLGVSISAAFGWSIFTLYKNHENLSLPKEPVLIPLALFWLMAFASIFWSEAPFVSLLGFCILTALPLTIFTGALCPSAAPQEKMQRALFVIMSVLGIWAIIQFFVFNEIVDGRARHPLANPNSLAVLFNIGFFLALGAIYKTKDKLALVTALLCLAGLMATGSRGALLAALPTLIFFMFMTRSSFKHNAKYLVLIVCAACTFFVFSSVGQKSDETMAARTLRTVSGTSQDISANRFEIWKGAEALIKEHGLIGTGIGTFFLYYDEFRTKNEIAGASHAHSDPLQFWAELGVAGLILFYAILILVLVRTVTALRRKDLDSSLRLTLISSFSALLAVAIHAHYSFPLYNLSVLFLTGFVFLIWLAAVQGILKTGSFLVLPKLKSDLRGALVVVPLICCWLVFSLYVTSEHFVNRARVALFEGRLEDMAADLEIAGRLGFQANSRAYMLAVNVPLALLEQKDVPLSLEQRKALFEEANDYLGKAWRYNKRLPSVPYYTMRALDLAGPEAIDEGSSPDFENGYRETLRLDPMHLGARMALARYYQEKGQEDQAYQVLKDGLIYYYRAPITPQYLGQVIGEALIRKDTETKKKAAAKLKQYFALLQSSEKRSATGFLGEVFGAKATGQDRDNLSTLPAP